MRNTLIQPQQRRKAKPGRPPFGTMAYFQQNPQVARMYAYTDLNVVNPAMRAAARWVAGGDGAEQAEVPLAPFPTFDTGQIGWRSPMEVIEEPLPPVEPQDDFLGRWLREAVEGARPVAASALRRSWGRLSTFFKQPPSRRLARRLQRRAALVLVTLLLLGNAWLAPITPSPTHSPPQQEL